MDCIEFSNMLLAYAALSDEMKARIEPLHMVHYYEFGRRIYPQLPPVSHEERIEVPPTCHPLVRVHADRDHARSLFITTNAGNEITAYNWIAYMHNIYLYFFCFFTTDRY